jgi:hypothetical protein
MLNVLAALWGRPPAGAIMPSIPGDVPGFTSPSKATMVAALRSSVPVP